MPKYNVVLIIKLKCTINIALVWVLFDSNTRKYPICGPAKYRRRLEALRDVVSPRLAADRLNQNPNFNAFLRDPLKV